jgi:uncharacterized protein YwgA/O-acetyl-ADP-ribose deacetylase (regulator of RNase III)
MTTGDKGGLEERDGGNIALRSGNLFESGAQAIVITVNCVGVMGKGIALEAKERYPDLFKEYVELCASKKVRLGRPVYVSRLIPPSFLLFPTKDHWRSVSKLADIEEGLRYLAEHHREWKISSIAVPPLGCGYGGLEWAVVGPALYRGLAKLEVPVFLYVPTGIPTDVEQLGRLRSVSTLKDVENARRTSPPEIVAIVLALEHALQARPNKEIGRVLMQKLGYFARAAGIPAPIHFTRKSYGPYSTDWMAQIRHLVNNGLLVERQVGPKDAFAYEPGPSLREYAARIESAVEPYMPAVRRVGAFIARLSPDQAEFAATTHMVATELYERRKSEVDDSEIIATVQDWKRRRGKPFPEDRLRSCLAWLRSEGWLPAHPTSAADAR